MVSNNNKRPLIALLTDFGTTDPYVGSLKASLFRVCPEVAIIDLCHHIQPQNVLQAAFVLRMVYRDYPDGTIFVCVVDPGVGGARLPIALAAGPYCFVGPDNGLFSYIYQEEEIREIVTLTNRDLWQQPVSDTFHGRDIFAPCAAWLARNKQISELGSPLDQDPKHLTLPLSRMTEDQTIEGQVLHIDRFGNLITNIHHNDFERVPELKQAEILVADWTIPLGRTYESKDQESLLGVWNSSGFLEIAARNGSAQEMLDCELKEAVVICITTPAP